MYHTWGELLWQRHVVVKDMIGIGMDEKQGEYFRPQLDGQARLGPRITLQRRDIL